MPDSDKTGGGKSRENVSSGESSARRDVHGYGCRPLHDYGRAMAMGIHGYGCRTWLWMKTYLELTKHVTSVA